MTTPGMTTTGIITTTGVTTTAEGDDGGPAAAAAAAAGWNRARGRWNGWLHLVMLVPTVLLFAFLLVGWVLATSLTGLLWLAMMLPLTRAFLNLHRRDAARLLRQPVPSPYREVRRDQGAWLFRILRLKDPQTWRDQLYLFLSMTVGVLLSATSVALFLAIFWYLSAPIWLGAADGLDHEYGVFSITFDSTADGFLLWSHAALAAALWWYGAPWLMWVRAKIDLKLLGPTEHERVRQLQQRVDVLAESRSDAVDIQAAELRRIERDLHDGAQARLVSSGMTVGMALEVIDEDPAAAKAMLHEARATTQDALADLRRVVRGIHPPVLADRGLVGAVRAIAEKMAPSVEVTSDLDGRPPAPVESAVYFAAAECLANIGKHAAASAVTVHLHHQRRPPGTGLLTVTVEDDGVGGARVDPAGGLAGIARRLAVFDGTLDLSSPEGGPTRLTITVPCDLSPLTLEPP